MIRRSFTALLLLPLSALAQTQVPNVFEDGTPALAAEVNENFQYVLENASGGGGCSATQQDNSVLIECADGTSGVLAGTGMAVIIPSGSVGEAPDISAIPVGNFYWQDGNGVVVSEAFGNMNNGSFEVRTEDGIVMSMNQSDAQQATFVGVLSYSVLYYTEADCGGAPYIMSNLNVTHHFNEQFWLPIPTEIEGEQTIVKSTRVTDRYHNDNFGIWEIQECENTNDQLARIGKFLAPYTPPAEWLNAAYPLTLVQKP